MHKIYVGEERLREGSDACELCSPFFFALPMVIYYMRVYVRQLLLFTHLGGVPRVVISTAAFHGRVRGSVPGLGGLKETKIFLPHPRVKLSIVGGLRDREVACSASDRQGTNFESCVWRTVSSHSFRHPQDVLLAQFSLFVHRWPEARFISFSFTHLFSQSFNYWLFDYLHYCHH